MKIAQVSPLMEAIPPRFYGGTERIVAYLCDELTDLGHQVTLFASADSTTKARLEPVWPCALRLDNGIRDYLAPHIVMLERLARRAAEFDIVHLHVDYLAYPIMRRAGVPFLATLHGRLDQPELRRIYEIFADVPVVSISNAQRDPLPQANYIATIHHGIPEPRLPARPGESGYLAFLGRISPEKAPDAAIKIAAKAGVPLKIAAKIDRVDQQYFARNIQPLLAMPHVEFIGEIGDDQKAAFLSNAVALLFPIAWREPFGLAMIEAMACGTPVIAFRRGSVPEIVDDGITGFVVENETQAAAAVGRLNHLDRGRIRGIFEERFTARRMAENYLDIYQRLMAPERPLRRAV
jgi:glycosyltransferase involved in cell wall biosynthesis